MKTTLFLALALCTLVVRAQETKSIIELTTPVERVVYEPLTKLFVGEAVLIRPTTDANVEIKNIHLISQQAEISREGDDFVVIAKQTGEITLRFYDYSIIEKPVLIETKTLMAVANFPSTGMSASLNGKTGGRISHSEFVEAGELKMLILNKDKSFEDSTLKIVSYTMSVFHKERDPVLNIHSDGSKLTPEMKTLIKESPKGAKVYFEYVKAQSASSADHSTRSLPPLAFVLSDE